MDGRARYSREFYRLSRISNAAEVVAFLAAAITGGCYLLTQYLQLHVLTDLAFVILLVLATLLLLVGERYTQDHLLRRGLVFFCYALDQDFCSDVMRSHYEIAAHLYLSQNRIFCGVVYGMTVAAAPIFLDVWSGHATQQYLLVLFLFLVNYITGNVMYSLVRFLIDSQSLSRMIRLDVWNSRNPSTEFYVRSILTIALFASLYVSLSMTSILFSPINRTLIVYLYVAFSFAVLAVTLVYPYMPIVRRLVDAKRRVRYRIGQRLFALSEDMLGSADIAADDGSIDEMRRLLELQRSVDAVDIIPFRSASVSVVTAMAFIFSHPFLLEWMLKIPIGLGH